MKYSFGVGYLGSSRVQGHAIKIRLGFEGTQHGFEGAQHGLHLRYADHNASGLGTRCWWVYPPICT